MVDDLVNRANTMALAANISYGVAGAAAITAVLLFFLEDAESSLSLAGRGSSAHCVRPLVLRINALSLT